MLSARIIATGFAITILGVVGLVVTRSTHRRFAVALVATGVILGVGVHPFDDPSVLMDVLMGDGDGESGAALALRSSTRAVPILVLGVALGAGALVDALGAAVPARHPRVRTGAWLLAAAVLAWLAVGDLPALTGTRLVDPALQRDEDARPGLARRRRRARRPPDGIPGAAVPGAEFGAFRWGYTVDPPLPGLTDRPLVTRDLLPLGSAGRDGPAVRPRLPLPGRDVEPTAMAPVARLLGADTIWVANDAAFDRFRTPRPELVHDLFAGGLAGRRPPRTSGRRRKRARHPDGRRGGAVRTAVGTRLAAGRAGRRRAIRCPSCGPRSTAVVSRQWRRPRRQRRCGLIDGTELVRYAASLR